MSCRSMMTPLSVYIDTGSLPMRTNLCCENPNCAMSSIRIFIIRSLVDELHLMSGDSQHDIRGRNVMQLRISTLLAPLYRPCFTQLFVFLIYVMCWFFEVYRYTLIDINFSVPATYVSNSACNVCSYGLCWH